jgi:hypothetical protein
MQTVTPYIEIKIDKIERDDATPNAVLVRLSAAPTPVHLPPRLILKP